MHPAGQQRAFFPGTMERGAFQAQISPDPRAVEVQRALRGETAIQKEILAHGEAETLERIAARTPEPRVPTAYETIDFFRPDQADRSVTPEAGIVIDRASEKQRVSDARAWASGPSRRDGAIGLR